jgi:hypothetical protein
MLRVRVSNATLAKYTAYVHLRDGMISIDVWDVDGRDRPTRYNPKLGETRSMDDVAGKCLPMKYRQQSIAEICFGALTDAGGPVTLRFELDSSRSRFTDQREWMLARAEEKWTMVDSATNNPVTDILAIVKASPANIIDLRTQ